jgi:hypothetical protein
MELRSKFSTNKTYDRLENDQKGTWEERLIKSSYTRRTMIMNKVINFSMNFEIMVRYI